MTAPGVDECCQLVRPLQWLRMSICQKSEVISARNCDPPFWRYMPSTRLLLPGYGMCPDCEIYKGCRRTHERQEVAQRGTASSHALLFFPQFILHHFCFSAQFSG